MKNYSALLIASTLLILNSCKKKDIPTIPTLTTTAVTNITTSTATSGGTITSNGGADITASGVCWSKVNATPTIADDTTKSATANGTFVANLKNITPSATWYVRAYATNSAGTGYGNVVTFNTGNGAPEARVIVITGLVKVAERLTATYTYFDYENDVESGTTFQWYRANDGAGTGEVAIAGATTLTYNIQAIDEFKYIRISITTKSSAGTSPGAEMKSAFVGPVAAPATTVTFTYNGASVTYGILVSPVTGRRWLDRNLGAPNAASSYDDWPNYGDVFQWGRGVDGHQTIARTGPTISTGGGTTTTLSTTDNPGHSLFILNDQVAPYDWRVPSNDNLWQGVNGINNPCPAGWRLPDSTEWTAEAITSIEAGYTQLKLTLGGNRGAGTGLFTGITSQGHYWSSKTVTPSIFGSANYLRARLVSAGSSGVLVGARTSGKSCRCIKD